MKEFDIKRNASGYYDDTAYKAMTTDPKPGEIWLHGTSGHYLLIISNINGVCSTLRLTDRERPDAIKVTFRTPMYTTPIMIGYCFATVLSQYVKSVTEEEFQAVRYGVADALGLMDLQTVKPVVDCGTHPHILEEKVKALEDERNKLLEEIAGYGDTIKKQGIELQAREKTNIMLGEELTKASHEAEKALFYKEMYDSLMDRVMAMTVKAVGVNE